MKKLITPERIENPVSRFWILTVASGLGLGYSPFAPGTAGSLLGIPFGLLLLKIPMWLALAICALLMFPLSWISGRAGRHWGNADSGRIVIDEVLGQGISLLGLRHLILASNGDLSAAPAWMYAVGFLLFRIFDIGKPFPARTFDRQATGFGVMADDVVAGLYAALVLRAIASVWFS